MPFRSVRLRSYYGNLILTTALGQIVQSPQRTISQQTEVLTLMTSMVRLGVREELLSLLNRTKDDNHKILAINPFFGGSPGTTEPTFDK
jgi:hypothetical protein